MAKIHTVSLDDKVYPLGYKVVTEDMKSLGLRNNPNIITYPVGEWYCLPEDDLLRGKDDWGGIWVARSLSGARTLTRYMRSMYGKHARTFRACIDEVLYANSYRIKTNGVLLLDEVHHPLTEKHLPAGLPDALSVIADKVFFSMLNTPLSTDPVEEDFYFTVPKPILDGLSKKDRSTLLSVLQCDQLSPRVISWYIAQDASREDSPYAARDLLLRGTELAETIEDDSAREFARARIWHHAAGTCYMASPEHQRIAVESIDALVSRFKNADDETKAILAVWERYIHKRMDDFLECDVEMRPLREKKGVPSKD